MPLVAPAHPQGARGMSLVRNPGGPPPSQSTWPRCVSAAPARRAACRGAARSALMSPAGASRPRLSPLASDHKTTQQRACHPPSSTSTSPTGCSDAVMPARFDFSRILKVVHAKHEAGFGWSLLSRRERMHIRSRRRCACDNRCRGCIPSRGLVCVRYGVTGVLDPE